MIYGVFPNYFNDYLAMPVCQSLNPLYTFTHKKKTAKLTAFNLITNKTNYGTTGGASGATKYSSKS